MTPPPTRFRHELPMLLGLVALAVLATIVWTLIRTSLDYADNQQYRAMIQGDWEGVVEPYASRALATWLATGLRAAFGLTPEAALLLLNLGALTSTLLIVALWLRSHNVPASMILVFLTLPSFALVARYGLTVDGIALLLTVLVFVSLAWASPRQDLPTWPTRPIAGTDRLRARGSMVTGATTFLAATLRLDTAIHLLPVALLAWRQAPYRRVLLGMMLGVLLAIPAASSLKPAATDNIHGMNQGLYMALKMPVNGLSNYLGIRLYVETFGDNHRCDPFYWQDVSFLPGLGQIERVGVCYNGFAQPLHSLVCLLTLFGIFPFLLWRAWRQGFLATRLAQVMALWAVFLALLAPTLGVTTIRFYVLAIPPLLLVLPSLAAMVAAGPDWLKRLIWLGLPLNLLVAWVLIPA